MNTKKVLVVVDYQNDFASPQGALYVPQAETIAQTIQSHIDDNVYQDVIYTLDTHIPEEYEISEESKMFPSHCEYGTDGWEFFEITPRNSQIKEKIKNTDKKQPVDFSEKNEFVFIKDKFSIWEGNSNYENFITSRYEKDTEFVIVGVATNYCVYQNAMGYKKFGFKNISVIESATKGILDETFEANIEKMKIEEVKYI